MSSGSMKPIAMGVDMTPIHTRKVDSVQPDRPRSGRWAVGLADAANGPIRTLDGRMKARTVNVDSVCDSAER